MKKSLLFAVIGILALGGGAGAFLFMKGKGEAPAAADGAADSPSAEAAAEGHGPAATPAESGGHGAPAASGGPGAPAVSAEGGPVASELAYSFERPFIVTLADSRISRTLQFNVSLELSSAGYKSKIDLNAAKFRDAIISEVSGRTSVEIQSPEGKERLKRDLIRRINGLLDSPSAISSVYFPDFVVLR